MTITTFTTFDTSIRVTDSNTHLFILYARALEQPKAADGSRYFHLTEERDLSMSVDINGREYHASGVMLPRQKNPAEPELMIVWVKTAEPATYYVFTLYAEYSAWGTKMDVVQVVGNADEGIDEFLKLSAARKRHLLGLS
jgi:hypothetical protein